MTGSLTAGQVGFRPVRVVPEPLDRAKQRVVAGSTATLVAPQSRYSWRTAWPVTAVASRTGTWSR